MSSRKLVRWLVVGVLVAAALQAIQVVTLGRDRTALLSVGSESALRPLIEAELGDVYLAPGGGHDGQTSYLVARYPTGGEAIPFDHTEYRYRRILYPALSGGFGLFGPELTLWGLQAWAIIGVGLATAGIASVAHTLRLSRWVVAGVLLNPGVWLSVQLLTPDALALGFVLVGLALCLEDRWLSGALLLGAAALTKDHYVVTALGLAGWAWWSLGQRTQAMLVGLVPVGALGTWAWTIGTSEGLSVRGTLDWPLFGLARASSRWAEDGLRGLAFGALAAFGLVVATVSSFLARRSLYAWLTVPWVALGLLASTWVWDHGNNALRVLAPVWVFGALSCAAAVTSRQQVGA